MLKKLAADALGISDIGKIIAPADYNKVDADDYVMHEDGEKIYFIIKSKTDEYCFTNFAFIHLDGASAISSKRLLKRYDYYKNGIKNVLIETAGTVDLDAEIKFSLGEVDFSIDVDKKQIEQLKDLYKALVKMSQMMEEQNRMMSYSQTSIQTAVDVISSVKEASNLSQEFQVVNEYTFNWLQEAREKIIVKDYGTVFEKYINN